MIDSFEISKIAGAVLAALLVIFGTKTFIEIRGESHAPEKPGFELAAPPPEAKAGEAAAPAAAAFSFAEVAKLLPTAKPENGQATFKKCAACHTGDKAGANKVGPHLWGVVGRKAGSVEGFSYSEPMKSKGTDWTFEQLANFIHSPKTALPGTKMVFPGIPNAGDLADLLAYLRTLSDSPVPLPK